MSIAMLLTLIAWPAAGPDALYTTPQVEDAPRLVSQLADANLRHGAARALARLGPAAVPPLIDRLQQTAALDRLWMAWALGRIGPDARTATAALAAATTDDDDALRAAAVEALGKLGPAAEAALPALIAALDDRERRVRTWAAKALVEVGPESPETIQALILRCVDPVVRPVALQGLVQIGSAAEPRLTAALDDPALRIDAIVALRRMGGGAAALAGVERTTAADLPALLHVLGESQRGSHAHCDAVELLAELKSEAAPAVPLLLAALEDAEVRAAAAKALSQIGTPAVTGLIDPLRHEQPAVRLAAAAALRGMGVHAAGATDALVELLADMDSEVCRAACDALAAIGPSESAVGALIEVLRNHPAELTCQAAIKALGRADPAMRPMVIEALQEAVGRGNFGVRTMALSVLGQIDPDAARQAGAR